MLEASGRRCPQCGSGVLVQATARGRREALTFLLGADIRRCLICEERSICFRQFSMRSQTNADDDFSLTTVWLAIFSGVIVCLGIALWTLRKFHRWPF